MLRVEDVRAIALLCAECHQMQRHTNPLNRKKVITDAQMLWLKQNRDPANWDWEFLCSIWIGNRPPEPAEPVWIRDIYKRGLQWER